MGLQKLHTSTIDSQNSQNLLQEASKDFAIVAFLKLRDLLIEKIDIKDYRLNLSVTRPNQKITIGKIILQGKNLFGKLNN